MTNYTREEKGIHTDFRNNMTYADYLQLDGLLSSQKPISSHHDEPLFIIIHQVQELWMKLTLHELRAATVAIDNGDIQPAFKMLARVTRIQYQLIQAWEVLSTLTPAEYLEFRDILGNASGFQSYQYRLLEFALGYKKDAILKIYKKDQKIYDMLQKAFYQPSIYDVAIRALDRAGFDIHSQVLNRDYSKTYEAEASVKNAWKKVYENASDNWELYQLAEKLVDLEDALSQWRFRHMKTVERIIGHKVGTGGSSGVGYLKNVLDHRFFPELWDVRTEF
ncbi:tryptophan 2,3-dioxygenase [Oceanobacillus sp. Castelsardo]|uniref:tryptophan 2,3-dioxygenase n=1 Tax=Oceanobacillus sp. Castelsardo TaxID=1851204 RepID=UPI000838BB36|nr:tryptophan 2,3-dioxygenase [Oceanobacillus sp. Castelsardo]